MRSNRTPKGYRLLVLFAAALILLTLNSAPSAAQSYSHARIVRLSFVEGTVTLHRPGVDQWAKAFINTPIEQGFKLATAGNSFAEVEFENGSTVRIGQLSELDFTNLSLSPEGGKINHMTLKQGYATFTVMPKSGDVYQVRAAGSTYRAADKSMFRVDVEQEGQRLEVFKGRVDAQSSYGDETIARNHVLRLVPTAAKPLQVSEGITEDAWDRWVNKRQQTETVARNRTEPGSSGAYNSIYGWSDLSYYGNWTSLPGYGSCWAPSMGAGWSPYSIGRWAWYPSFGYTWISGLPWGWLPFHYGSWISPSGTGWCWLPGNFSAWSPGLVTWYEGPGWVGWMPRTYGGGGGTVSCRVGQRCSTTVSLNTFQRGRPISPNDVVRVRPFHGHAINSPTIPLTRDLRLPGPAVAGPPLNETMREAREPSGMAAGSAHVATTANAARMRVRRVYAAPRRVFARSSIRGAWDVQPHAAALSPRFRQFRTGFRPGTHMLHSGTPNAARRLNGTVRMPVSRSTTVGKPAAPMRGRAGRSTGIIHGRPAVNNDVLLRGRQLIRQPASRPGNRPAALSSIPLSTTTGHHSFGRAKSTSLMPSARPMIKAPSFPQRQMHGFRQNRFPARNQSFRNPHNARQRSQMRMNRRPAMRQQHVERPPAFHPAPHNFGGGRMMNQGGGRRMGGEMRSSRPAGMGGGMRSGPPAGGGGEMRGGGSHGPHH